MIIIFRKNPHLSTDHLPGDPVPQSPFLGIKLAESHQKTSSPARGSPLFEDPVLVGGAWLGAGGGGQRARTTSSVCCSCLPSVLVVCVGFFLLRLEQLADRFAFRSARHPQPPATPHLPGQTGPRGGGSGEIFINVHVNVTPVPPNF